jgi:hypothetical protein
MFKPHMLAWPAALLMLAGLLTGLLTQPAFAAIVITNLGAYDPTFSANCADGTVAPGADNPCEYAVAETKRGLNNGSGGNAQLYIRAADFSPVLDDANIPTTAPWGGTNLVVFTWLLQGNQGGTGDLSLTFTIGGTDYTTSVTGGQFASGKDPSLTDEFYLRLAATNSSNPSWMEILSITTGGSTTTYASNVHRATASAEEEYLQVEGVDFAGTWSMSGDASFNFAGSSSSGRPGAQFKLTQGLPVEPEEIPVPATAALLIVGLGGVALRRRPRGGQRAAGPVRPA